MVEYNPMTLRSSIVEATIREPHGEAAYKVAEKLLDAGFDTWWVGGVVRDMLQDEETHDIDIATAALPEDILRIFPNAKVAEEQLGSTRVRSGLFVFELTTFRKDSSASQGRKPVTVQFGTRDEDAKRRDLTINALYVHPITHELFDPFGGEADLKERLIRFIGEPLTRLQQDPLRLLRAIRMRARISGQYHPETFAALQASAALVAVLSGARQREEFEKLLLFPHAERGLEDMWEFTIMEHMIPELHHCKGIPQPADFHHEGDVWDHLLQCVAAFQEDDLLDVRIATLFHDIGKIETFALKDRIRFDHHAEISSAMAMKILTRFGMPSRRREKIVWLIAHHMMMDPLLTMSEERKTHWYHHPWFEDLLRLFRLDIAGTTPADYSLYVRIVSDRNHFLDTHPQPLRPLLTGDDIMALLRLKPSARVGMILDQLREEQEKGTINTKRAAQKWVLLQVDEK